MSSRRWFTSTSLALVVALASGCGGSNATAPRPVGSIASAAHTTATLKIDVPSASTTAATARKPAYVSPATQSIAISFTPAAGGSTQTFNENLTPATNSNCTASLISPEVCTVTLVLSPGAYTATFATYDGLLDGNNNPTGNVLSQNQSVPVTIVAGQINNINITLQGVPASVAFIPGTASTLSRTAANAFTLSKCFANQSVSVIGVDADRNYIVGPGAPTPSLTSSDTTQLAVAAPQASAPNTFTLTRPGIPNANASIMLTATLTPGSGGGSATSASISLTFDATICGSFTEYTVPTANSEPSFIAAGPDGALWFTEHQVNKIGRLSTSGAFTEYTIPTSSSTPACITSGSDGALWFTEESQNNIGRISTSGTFTEYAIPSANSYPSCIASGPDGGLWFTEQGGSKIGRVSTGGAFTEYAVPTVSSDPFDIVSGPDGGMWFIESAKNQIGRISTSGAFTEYPIPTVNSEPFSLALGQDGALWFAELNGNKIGRITTSGGVTEYTVPTANSWPYGIASGPDGALWFAEDLTDKIGRISTSGAFTEYAIPTSGSASTSIVTGPDGTLWFTEEGGNKIGQLR